MRIGELGRRTGVSVRMLRYYEEQGLLAPGRTLSGYRSYTATDVMAVETIRLLGDAGMTLPVIRRFLPCALDARGTFQPCDELREIIAAQIAAVDRRATSLARSRAALTAILTRDQGAPVFHPAGSATAVENESSRGEASS